MSGFQGAPTKSYIDPLPVVNVVDSVECRQYSFLVVAKCILSKQFLSYNIPCMQNSLDSEHATSNKTSSDSSVLPPWPLTFGVCLYYRNIPNHRGDGASVESERPSRARHVKTASTVNDPTASVMGKLVRGAA